MSSNLKWNTPGQSAPEPGWYWMELDNEDGPVVACLPDDVDWDEARTIIFRYAGPLIPPPLPAIDATEAHARAAGLFQRLKASSME